MLRFLNKLFNIKPEYNWQYTSVTTTYDLTKHPDISPNSPIKEFKLVNNFRYCPKYKKLQNSSRITNTYYDVSLSEYIRLDEINDLVKRSDLTYNREVKLKKLKIC
jgi:hypothetical protein